MKNKKFFKTTVQVEILSENPLQFENLNDLNYLITEGDCSGRFFISKVNEISGKDLVKECSSHQSDPEFFGVDENGNSIN